MFKLRCNERLLNPRYVVARGEGGHDKHMLGRKKVAPRARLKDHVGWEGVRFMGRGMQSEQNCTPYELCKKRI